MYVRLLFVCLYRFLYVCMNAYMHVSKYEYHVCMRVCTYIFICVVSQSQVPEMKLDWDSYEIL